MRRFTTWDTPCQALKDRAAAWRDLGPGVDPILGGVQRLQPGLEPIAAERAAEQSPISKPDLQFLRDLPR